MFQDAIDSLVRADALKIVEVCSIGSCYWTTAITYYVGRQGCYDTDVNVYVCLPIQPQYASYTYTTGKKITWYDDDEDSESEEPETMFEVGGA